MIRTSDPEVAARALKRGGLVAFPTETVYGLGADAENPSAVARVFAAKGRPTEHPLIVHLASQGELARWVTRVPQAATRLAEAFWPGPLTLLLEKAARVPAATTGGLASVGLRVPAHPLALELLQRFGGGIAAPSANRFGRVSPTSAEHVSVDLGDAVDVLLDGGECSVGVESTIVDLTGETPVLLRPGGVTAEELEAVLGVSVLRTPGGLQSERARAPGMLASHYAPDARVEIVPAEALASQARARLDAGLRVAVLLSRHDDRRAFASLPGVILLDLGPTDASAAQHLYAALRLADLERAAVILASPPAARGLGEALADRLSKAAGPR